MRKAFLCALAFLAPLLVCTATPVSREYVDSKFDELFVSYVYSDNLPPTNALNSVGQMFKVTTPNPRGGIWQISGGSSSAITTYNAYLTFESSSAFQWASQDNVLQVQYEMATGKISVRFNYEGETTSGEYSTGAKRSPLKNMLTNDRQHESGAVFDSLKYIPQGAFTRALTPYDSFLPVSKYNADMRGVVKSVNGQSGPNVSLNIPSIAGLASETYVNNSLNSLIFQKDPYEKEYTPQSIVGRINSLEKTQQEYQHNVVYDLWAEDFSQVINGKGQVFNTSETPFGRWERTTISQPDVVLEQYKTGSEDEETHQFEWKSDSNNTIAYQPETGIVLMNGREIGTIEPYLNPLYGQDLGQVTNAVEGNIYKFTVKGWIKLQPARTQVTFDESLPNKTVTGLNYDGRKDLRGIDIYDQGRVKLPNYTGMFMTFDMDSWSAGYADKSVVGRIKYLESGGANKEYLTRKPLSDFTDTVTATNNSIIGNFVRVKNDYTTHQKSTNIAEYVSKQTIDKQHIKSKGFYDKDEVDEIIQNSVEQKRVTYLYDDQDNPTQVVDSRGRLFMFGIEDFGGSFNVTFSDRGDAALGAYKYAGKTAGTNVWKNANGYKIWFDAATGTLGDPSITYEPDPNYIGCDPEQCAVLPNINTTYTVATFSKQTKHESGPYAEPYDRFSLKTETDDLKVYTDRKITDTVDYLTNVVPHLNVGADLAASRRFSPIFAVVGDITPGSIEHTYKQIDDTIRIQMPAKTDFHKTIDVQFQAKIPKPKTNGEINGIYYFIKSSNEETVPTVGLQCTNNWYTSTEYFVVFNYPTQYRVRVNDISLFNSSQPCTVRLLVEKNAGFATLTVSNIVNNISQSFKSSVDTRPNSSIDSMQLCLTHPTKADGAFMLDLDSFTVEYDNTGKNKLVGTFATNYVKADTIYAEQQLGSEVGIMLGLASPEKYGVVKPDGVTIRVENGKLVSDAGGMQEAQVRALLGATDMDTVYAGYSQQSMVGRIKQLESEVEDLRTRLAALLEQYQLLYDSVTNSASKIENALGGN